MSLSVAACSGTSDTPAVAHSAQALQAVPQISSSVDTPALHGYDDAPRAVDSDDPAIWVHPSKPEKSLIIGALKDAGLQVYDLSGHVLQTIVPPNRPAVSAADPAVPGPQPDPGTSACPESESGETYGRYNNVDVQYDIEALDADGGKRRVDLVVVTDRGCDRVRFYRVDPKASAGPLVDVTSPDAPRVFPKRFVQPSPFQPGKEDKGVHDNPLDDQSTAYGLTLYRPHADGKLEVFVTQRSRSVVAQLKVVATESGFSYEKAREFRFPGTFPLPAADGGESCASWAPCREDPEEDAQLEGLVVDQETGTLYAAQETIGVWRLQPSAYSAAVVDVALENLVEKTRSFGAGYWAVPGEEEGEFSCEAPSGSAPDGAIVVAGSADLGGEHLQADVEGLAIYYTDKTDEGGYLIVSSQGDDTFHIYARKSLDHLSSFQIEGTGETDGHEVVTAALGRAFPNGLLVAQNGKAPAPASTDPVNGFDYDNSTQFRLVDWANIASQLNLVIDTSHNPRDPH